MKPQSGHTDRRIKRSQRQLKQAFMELMREKGFPAITIQDIADRADVNRGTFYAHFPDKYALLETAIREKFRTLLETSLPSATGLEEARLRILIRTVLEHFKDMNGRCYPIDTVNPLFERAVQEELFAFLLHWLKQSRAGPGEAALPAETLALMTSWAIFGAAMDWSKGKSRYTSEQMTDQVITVLKEGALRLFPD